MKTVKLLALSLVLVLLLPLFGCSKSAADKIDPQYYALGKEALGLAEAYLDDSVSLSDAKARADALQERLDSLPLLPKEDPLYEQTDRVQLYIDYICSSFRLQKSETRTLALHDDLEGFVEQLTKLLGLGE